MKKVTSEFDKLGPAGKEVEKEIHISLSVADLMKLLKSFKHNHFDDEAQEIVQKLVTEVNKLLARLFQNDGAGIADVKIPLANGEEVISRVNIQGVLNTLGSLVTTS